MWFSSGCASSRGARATSATRSAARDDVAREDLASQPLGSNGQLTLSTDALGKQVDVGAGELALGAAFWRAHGEEPHEVSSSFFLLFVSAVTRGACGSGGGTAGRVTTYCAAIGLRDRSTVPSGTVPFHLSGCLAGSFALGMWLSGTLCV